MQFSKVWLLIIAAILSTCDVVKCHPQCLDFKPPFQSNNLEFCYQYNDFGCCTKQEEAVIIERFEFIKTQLSDTLLQTCELYLRNLLCQRCSPYAAHIYSAEQTMLASTFPGLCSNYCSEFYTNCKDLVKYITSDREILGTLNSKESFCLVVQLTDKDYCYPDLLNNEHLNFNISIQQITKEGCMCVEHFAWDLRNPVIARHAGDGSGRLFVAEQRGVIYIYYRNKTREQKAFLDIKDRVLYSTYISDERGFLGLAFHPSFALNRKFYTYYSAKLGKRKECIRISEFKVSRKNRNRASRKTERILLQVEQPFSNHNGGEILFGDDNYLYIFIGDGGSGGDPYGNSQNKSVLLGKVLRINVNKKSDGKRYSIPPTNPFVNENGTRPEIFAYGIRNIWRCDKDEGDRITGMNKGRIICGDVGQNAYEEIDILVKGANYGWNGREGYQCFHPGVCGMVGPEELPIFSYPHSVGKSVTGGHVYRGCENPNLNGYYIYGDFTNGRLFYLQQFNESQIWLNNEIHMCGDDICFNGLMGNYSPFILSFGEDQYGEIYILSTNVASATTPTGNIYKLVDPFRRGNPELCEPQLTYNNTDVPYNISGEWLHSSGDNYDEYGSAECLDPSGFTCTFIGLEDNEVETSEHLGNSPNEFETSEEAEDDYIPAIKLPSSNSDIYVKQEFESFDSIKGESTSDVVNGQEKEQHKPSVIDESLESTKYKLASDNITYSNSKRPNYTINANYNYSALTPANYQESSLSFRNYLDSTSPSQNYLDSTSTSPLHTDLHTNTSTKDVFDSSSASGDFIDSSSASGDYLDSSSASGDNLDSSSASGDYLDSISGSGDYPDSSSASGDHLHSSSISRDHLHSSSVSRDHLHSSSISRDHLYSSSISRDHLHSSSISRNHLHSSSLSRDHLHSSSATGSTSASGDYPGSNSVSYLGPSSTYENYQRTRIVSSSTSSHSTKYPSIYKFIFITSPHPTSVINSDLTTTISPKIYPHSTGTSLKTPHPTPVSTNYLTSSSILRHPIINITTVKVSPHYSSGVSNYINKTSSLYINGKSHSVVTISSPSTLRFENNVESSSSSEDDLQSSSDSEHDLESSSSSGNNLESNTYSGDGLKSRTSSGDDLESSSSSRYDLKSDSDTKVATSSKRFSESHIKSSMNYLYSSSTSRDNHGSSSAYGHVLLYSSMSVNYHESRIVSSTTTSHSNKSPSKHRFLSVTNPHTTSVIISHLTTTISSNIPHPTRVSTNYHTTTSILSHPIINITTVNVSPHYSSGVSNYINATSSLYINSKSHSVVTIGSPSTLRFENNVASSSFSEDDLESSSDSEDDLESRTDSGHDLESSSDPEDDLESSSGSRYDLKSDSDTKAATPSKRFSESHVKSSMNYLYSSSTSRDNHGSSSAYEDVLLSNSISVNYNDSRIISSTTTTHSTKSASKYRFLSVTSPHTTSLINSHLTTNISPNTPHPTPVSTNYLTTTSMLSHPIINISTLKASPHSSSSVSNHINTTSSLYINSKSHSVVTISSQSTLIFENNVESGSSSEDDLESSSSSEDDLESSSDSEVYLESSTYSEDDDLESSSDSKDDLESSSGTIYDLKSDSDAKVATPYKRFSESHSRSSKDYLHSRSTSRYKPGSTSAYGDVLLSSSMSVNYHESRIVSSSTSHSTKSLSIYRFLSVTSPHASSIINNDLTTTISPNTPHPTPVSTNYLTTTSILSHPIINITTVKVSPRYSSGFSNYINTTSRLYINSKSHSVVTISSPSTLRFENNVESSSSSEDDLESSSDSRDDLKSGSASGDDLKSSSASGVNKESSTSGDGLESSSESGDDLESSSDSGHDLNFDVTSGEKVDMGNIVVSGSVSVNFPNHRSRKFVYVHSSRSAPVYDHHPSSMSVNYYDSRIVSSSTSSHSTKSPSKYRFLSVTSPHPTSLINSHLTTKISPNTPHPTPVSTNYLTTTSILSHPIINISTLKVSPHSSSSVSNYINTTSSLYINSKSHSVVTISSQSTLIFENNVETGSSSEDDLESSSSSEDDLESSSDSEDYLESSTYSEDDDLESSSDSKDDLDSSSGTIYDLKSDSDAKVATPSKGFSESYSRSSKDYIHSRSTSRYKPGSTSAYGDVLLSSSMSVSYHESRIVSSSTSHSTKSLSIYRFLSVTSPHASSIINNDLTTTISPNTPHPTPVSTTYLTTTSILSHPIINITTVKVSPNYSSGVSNYINTTSSLYINSKSHSVVTIISPSTSRFENNVESSSSSEDDLVSSSDSRDHLKSGSASGDDLKSSSASGVNKESSTSGDVLESSSESGDDLESSSDSGHDLNFDFTSGEKVDMGNKVVSGSVSVNFPNLRSRKFVDAHSSRSAPIYDHGSSSMSVNYHDSRIISSSTSHSTKSPSTYRFLSVTSPHPTSVINSHLTTTISPRITTYDLKSDSDTKVATPSKIFSESHSRSSKDYLHSRSTSRYKPGSTSAYGDVLLSSSMSVNYHESRIVSSSTSHSTKSLSIYRFLSVTNPHASSVINNDLTTTISPNTPHPTPVSTNYLTTTSIVSHPIINITTVKVSPHYSSGVSNYINTTSSLYINSKSHSVVTISSPSTLRFENNVESSSSSEDDLESSSDSRDDLKSGSASGDDLKSSSASGVNQESSTSGDGLESSSESGNDLESSSDSGHDLNFDFTSGEKVDMGNKVVSGSVSVNFPNLRSRKFVDAHSSRSAPIYDHGSSSMSVNYHDSRIISSSTSHSTKSPSKYRFMSVTSLHPTSVINSDLTTTISPNIPHPIPVSTNYLTTTSILSHPIINITTVKVSPHYSSGVSNYINTTSSLYINGKSHSVVTISSPSTLRFEYNVASSSSSEDDLESSSDSRDDLKSGSASGDDLKSSSASGVNQESSTSGDGLESSSESGNDLESSSDSGHDLNFDVTSGEKVDMGNIVVSGSVSVNFPNHRSRKFVYVHSSRSAPVYDHGSSSMSVNYYNSRIVSSSTSSHSTKSPSKYRFLSVTSPHPTSVINSHLTTTISPRITTYDLKSDSDTKVTTPSKIFSESHSRSSKDYLHSRSTSRYKPGSTSAYGDVLLSSSMSVSYHESRIVSSSTSHSTKSLSIYRFLSVTSPHASSVINNDLTTTISPNTPHPTPVSTNYLTTTSILSHPIINITTVKVSPHYSSGVSNYINTTSSLYINSKSHSVVTISSPSTSRFENNVKSSSSSEDDLVSSSDSRDQLKSGSASGDDLKSSSASGVNKESSTSGDDLESSSESGDDLESSSDSGHDLNFDFTSGEKVDMGNKVVSGSVSVNFPNLRSRKFVEAHSSRSAPIYDHGSSSMSVNYHDSRIISSSTSHSTKSPSKYRFLSVTSLHPTSVINSDLTTTISPNIPHPTPVSTNYLTTTSLLSHPNINITTVKVSPHYSSGVSNYINTTSRLYINGKSHSVVTISSPSTLRYENNVASSSSSEDDLESSSDSRDDLKSGSASGDDLKSSSASGVNQESSTSGDGLESSSESGNDLESSSDSGHDLNFDVTSGEKVDMGNIVVSGSVSVNFPNHRSRKFVYVHSSRSAPVYDHHPSSMSVNYYDSRIVSSSTSSHSTKSPSKYRFLSVTSPHPTSVINSHLTTTISPRITTYDLKSDSDTKVTTPSKIFSESHSRSSKDYLHSRSTSRYIPGSTSAYGDVLLSSSISVSYHESRIVSSSTSHSTKSLSIYRFLSVTSPHASSVINNDLTTTISPNTPHPTPVSTNYLTTTSILSHPIINISTLKVSPHSSSSVSNYINTTSSLYINSKSHSVVTISSQSTLIFENNVESGSSSEDDLESSSSSEDDLESSSDSEDYLESSTYSEDDDLESSSDSKDDLDSSSGTIYDLKSDSDAKVATPSKGFSESYSRSSKDYIHSRSTSRYKPGSTSAYGDVLLSSSMSVSYHESRIVSSSTSHSTKSLSIYRFLSVTSPHASSVINSDLTTTISPNTPHPTPVSTNYLTTTSILSHPIINITTVKVSPHYSSGVSNYINTTSSLYINSKSHSVVTISTPSTLRFENNVESSSSSEDDLESSSDSRDDLKSGSASGDDLKSSSASGVNQESSTSGDGLESSSESGNDLESSSDSGHDLNFNVTSGEKVDMGNIVVSGSVSVNFPNHRSRKFVYVHSSRSAPVYDHGSSSMSANYYNSRIVSSSSSSHSTKSPSKYRFLSVTSPHPTSVINSHLTTTISPRITTYDLKSDSDTKVTTPSKIFSESHSRSSKDYLHSRSTSRYIPGSTSAYGDVLLSSSMSVSYHESRIVSSSTSHSTKSLSIYRFLSVTSPHASSVINNDLTTTISPNTPHPTPVSTNYLTTTSILSHPIINITTVKVSPHYSSGVSNYINTTSSLYINSESHSVVTISSPSTSRFENNVESSSSSEDDLVSSSDSRDHLKSGSASGDDLKSSSASGVNKKSSTSGDDLESSSESGDDLESSSDSGHDLNFDFTSGEKVDMGNKVVSGSVSVNFPNLRSRKFVEAHSSRSAPIYDHGSSSMSVNYHDSRIISSSTSHSTKSPSKYRFLSVTSLHPTSVINSDLTTTISPNIPHPTPVSTNYLTTTSLLSHPIINITTVKVSPHYSSGVSNYINTTSRLYINGKSHSVVTISSPSTLRFENNVASSSSSKDDLESSSDSRDDLKSGSASGDDLKSSSASGVNQESSTSGDGLESSSESGNDLESSSDSGHDLNFDVTSGEKVDMANIVVSGSVSVNFPNHRSRKFVYVHSSRSAPVYDHHPSSMSVNYYDSRIVSSSTSSHSTKSPSKYRFRSVTSPHPTSLINSHLTTMISTSTPHPTPVSTNYLTTTSILSHPIINISTLKVSPHSSSSVSNYINTTSSLYINSKSHSVVTISSQSTLIFENNVESGSSSEDDLESSSSSEDDLESSSDSEDYLESSTYSEDDDLESSSDSKDDLDSSSGTIYDLKSDSDAKVATPSKGFSESYSRSSKDYIHSRSTSRYKPGSTSAYGDVLLSSSMSVNYHESRIVSSSTSHSTKSLSIYRFLSVTSPHASSVINNDLTTTISPNTPHPTPVSTNYLTTTSIVSHPIINITTVKVSPHYSSGVSNYINTTSSLYINSKSHYVVTISSPSTLRFENNVESSSSSEDDLESSSDSRDDLISGSASGDDLKSSSASGVNQESSTSGDGLESSSESGNDLETSSDSGHDLNFDVTSGEKVDMGNIVVSGSVSVNFPNHRSRKFVYVHSSRSAPVYDHHPSSMSVNYYDSRIVSSSTSSHSTKSPSTYRFLSVTSPHPTSVINSHLTTTISPRITTYDLKSDSDTKVATPSKIFSESHGRSSKDYLHSRSTSRYKPGSTSAYGDVLLSSSMSVRYHESRIVPSSTSHSTKSLSIYRFLSVTSPHASSVINNDLTTTISPNTPHPTPVSTNYLTTTSIVSHPIINITTVKVSPHYSSGVSNYINTTSSLYINSKSHSVVTISSPSTLRYENNVASSSSSEDDLESSSDSRDDLKSGSASGDDLKSSSASGVNQESSTSGDGLESSSESGNDLESSSDSGHDLNFDVTSGEKVDMGNIVVSGSVSVNFPNHRSRKFVYVHSSRSAPVYDHHPSSMSVNYYDSRIVSSSTSSHSTKSPSKYRFLSVTSPHPTSVINSHLTTTISPRITTYDLKSDSDTKVTTPSKIFSESHSRSSKDYLHSRSTSRYKPGSTSAYGDVLLSSSMSVSYHEYRIVSSSTSHSTKSLSIYRFLSVTSPHASSVINNDLTTTISPNTPHPTPVSTNYLTTTSILSHPIINITTVKVSPHYSSGVSNYINTTSSLYINSKSHSVATISSPSTSRFENNVESSSSSEDDLVSSSDSRDHLQSGSASGDDLKSSSASGVNKESSTSGDDLESSSESGDDLESSSDSGHDLNFDFTSGEKVDMGNKVVSGSVSVNFPNLRSRKFVDAHSSRSAPIYDHGSSSMSVNYYDSRIVSSSTSSHSTTSPSKYRFLSVTSPHPTSLINSHLTTKISPNTPHPTPVSTNYLTTTSILSHPIINISTLKVSPHSSSSVSNYINTTSSLYINSKSHSVVTISSQSTLIFENNVESGSSSEDDLESSSSSEDDLESSSDSEDYLESSTYSEDDDLESSSDSKDDLASSSGTIYDLKSDSDAKVATPSKGFSESYSRSSKDYIHSRSTSRYKPGSTSAYGDVLLSSSMSVRYHESRIVSSSTSHTIKSLSTYRFLSVTSPHASSVINSDLTTTILPNTPHPTPVSTNYLTSTSILSHPIINITTVKVNPHYSSGVSNYINTTSSHYINSKSHSVVTISSPSTLRFENNVESSSSSEDDLESSSDSRDDLKSGSASGDDLKSSSASGVNKESSTSGDGLESSSESGDDLESSSDSGHDLNFDVTSGEKVDMSNIVVSGSVSANFPNHRSRKFVYIHSSRSAPVYDHRSSSMSVNYYDSRIVSSSTSSHSTKSPSKYRFLSVTSPHPTSLINSYLTTTISPNITTYDLKSDSDSKVATPSKRFSESHSRSSKDYHHSMSTSIYKPGSTSGNGDVLLSSSMSVNYHDSRIISSLTSSHSTKSPSKYRFLSVTSLHPTSVLNSDLTTTISPNTLHPTPVSTNYLTTTSILSHPSINITTVNVSPHYSSGVSNYINTTSSLYINSKSHSVVAISSPSTLRFENNMASSSSSENDLESSSDSEDDLESSTDSEDDLESSSDSEDNLESSSGSRYDIKSDSDTKAATPSKRFSEPHVKSSMNYLYSSSTSRDNHGSSSAYEDVLLSSSMSVNYNDSRIISSTITTHSTKSASKYRFLSVTSPHPTSLINSHLTTKISPNTPHPTPVSTNYLTTTSILSHPIINISTLKVSPHSSSSVSNYINTTSSLYINSKSHSVVTISSQSTLIFENNVESGSSSEDDLESSSSSEDDLESSSDSGAYLESSTYSGDGDLESSSDSKDDLESSSDTRYDLKSDSDAKVATSSKRLSESHVLSCMNYLYSSSTSRDNHGSSSAYGDVLLSSSMSVNYHESRIVSSSTSSHTRISPSIYKFLSVTIPRPTPVINSHLTTTILPRIYPGSTGTFVTSYSSTPIQSSYRMFSYSPKIYADSAVTSLTTSHLTSMLISSLLNSSVLNDRTTTFTSSGITPHVSLAPVDYLNTSATLNIDDHPTSITKTSAPSPSRSKDYTDSSSASGDDLDTNSASGIDMDSNSASGEDMDSSSASGEDLDSNYGSGYYPDTSSPSGVYVDISSSRGEKPGSNSVSGNSIRSTKSNQNSTMVSTTTTSESISTFNNGNNSIPTDINKSGSRASLIHNPSWNPDSRKFSHTSSASSLARVDDIDYSSASGDNLDPNSASGDNLDPYSASGDNLDPNSASGDNLDPNSASGDNLDPNSASGDNLDPNSASGVSPEGYRSGNNPKISSSTFVDKVGDLKHDTQYRYKSKLLHAISSNYKLEKSLSNDIYIDNYPNTRSKQQTKQRKGKKKGWKSLFLKTQPITKDHSQENLRVRFQPSIFTKQSSDDSKDNIIQDFVPSDMYDDQDFETIPQR